MEHSATDRAASDALAKGLKGMGEKKLAELGRDVLAAILDRIGAPADEETTVDEMVKALLKKKRSKAISPPATLEIQPPSTPTQSPYQSHSNEPDKPKCTSPPLGIKVFKSKHRMRIIAFNSLKLRIDKEELRGQFETLVSAFAEVDVLLVSEVPAGGAKTSNRAAELRQMLESHGAKWEMVASQPSGPGTPEVHLVLAKHPVRVVKQVTTSSVNGVSLDHAPFTALVQDDRFGNFNKFVVTSVHFPPESRARQRDQQLSNFMIAYSREATLRCEMPFTEAGARDARASLPSHVVAGDFNSWVGDEKYALDKHGYEVLLGKNVPTTSGVRSFDNFVLSKHTRNNFAVSATVLELEAPQKLCKGVIGLSDHSPIMLMLER
jgi:endonuclease/exonuclease/phosphatase family metal-dependent hydrolase